MTRNLIVFISGVFLGSALVWFCLECGECTSQQPTTLAAASAASQIATDEVVPQLSAESHRLAADSTVVAATQPEVTAEAQRAAEEIAAIEGPSDPMVARLGLVYSRFQRSLEGQQSVMSQYLSAHTVIGHCIAIALDDAGRAVELAPDERASLSAGLPTEIRFTLDNRLYAVSTYEFPEFEATREALNTLLYKNRSESDSSEKFEMPTELVSQIDARVAASLAILDNTQKR